MTQIRGKDAELETTISKFTTALTELGLDLEFTNLKNPGARLFSIELHDKRLPEISTNGKGASLEAAKASALGEMSERYLNQTFFEDYWLGDKVADAKVARYHDEKWIKYPKTQGNAQESYTYLCDINQQICENYEDDFANLFEDEHDVSSACQLLKSNLPYAEKAKVKKSIGKLVPIPKDLFYPEFIKNLTVNCCRPFTDIVTSNPERGICSLPMNLENGEQKAYFPVRYLESIYCSNGMCSGNTPAEAKVQGLSEICERFVRRFLFGQITPKQNEALAQITNRSLPLIPQDYLEEHYPDITQYVQEFAQRDISIQCFDASLGGVYPVVAVLATPITKTKAQSTSSTKTAYKLSIGSHPDIRIALERSFTELMQGLDWQTLDFHDSVLKLSKDEKSKTKSKQDILTAIAKESSTKNDNFVQDFIDDSGEVCETFFSKKSEFSFCDWSFENHTTEEEYAHLLEIFTRFGKKVWCYDASWKELSAYRLIVPDFSEIYLLESPSFTSECKNTSLVRTLTAGFNECSNDEWQLLCDEIVAHFDFFNSLSKQFGLTETDDNPFTEIPVSFFHYNQQCISDDGQTEQSSHSERDAIFGCLGSILTEKEKKQALKIILSSINENTTAAERRKILASSSSETQDFCRNAGRTITVGSILPTVKADFSNFKSQKLLQELYLQMMKKRTCN